MTQYDVAIIGGGAAGLSAAPTTATSTTDHELSTRRLNTMRLGYAFMGVGLAIVKWPILVQSAASLPVSEGVVACLLTAMSLLAFLGLRYPVKLLPVLLFESAWKLLWLGLVAAPRAVSGGRRRRNPRRWPRLPCSCVLTRLHSSPEWITLWMAVS